jgi:hypothetical protein
VSAEQIARELGRARRCGDGWLACCPAHKDQQPSLSIRERGGRLVVHCFAGCCAGDIFAALRQRRLLDGPSTWHGSRQEPDLQADDARRTAYALNIWREARPALGTIVQSYLGSRGINLGELPAGARASLRFLVRCPRPKDEQGNRPPPLPAMVALVQHISHGPVAVHRTFILPDGSGKAPVDPDKASLGPVGGGAVRFGEPREGEWLAVGEGIENALSILIARGLPAWSALSANGIRGLILPPEAQLVLITADHDANGTGQCAAFELADRLLAEGRCVRLTMPPIADVDFNDILRGGAR